MKWIGYCSSTGVYGDVNGAWVTESDNIKPSTIKTQLRANAEKLWKNLYTRHGLPVHIFRLAGGHILILLYCNNLYNNISSSNIVVIVSSK